MSSNVSQGAATQCTSAYNGNSNSGHGSHFKSSIGGSSSSDPKNRRFNLDLTKVKAENFKKWNPGVAFDNQTKAERIRMPNYLADRTYVKEVKKIEHKRGGTFDFNSMMQGYMDENEKYEKRIKKIQTMLRG
jgi:hypothetical protein